MLKKTITYNDFEGKEKTKDFYFHMNQVEFTKLNGEVPGGLEKRVNDAIADQDTDTMLRIIDLLVSRSYGQFDEENEFTKIGKTGRPLYEKFVNTDAYDKLIIELITGEQAIVSFIRGIVPVEVKNRIDEEEARRRTENPPKLTPVTNE